MQKIKFIPLILLAAFALFAATFVSKKSHTLKPKKMKTYVLVHGAWAGKFAWDKVRPLLEKEGHKVLTLDLPAHGDDNTAIGDITLQSYVEAVSKVVNAQKDKVILVGHSMGGMVISQVAENLPAKIEKLVYLSAYLPANGQDLQSLSANDAGSLIGPNLVFAPDYSFATIKPEFAERVFAGDCTDDIKKLVLNKHKGEPLAPFQGKVTLTAANFGAVPKYYIETTKDEGVSTANQERMIAANGTVKQVFKLDCGHSPYFAKPVELATILSNL